MATDKEPKTSNSTVEPGDLSTLLKEYRESANLNTEQISDALCLNPTAINALENELFDSLPESPYIRGYLRHYAGLSGRDSKPLIDIYDKLRGESSSTTSVENSMNNNVSYQDVAQPLITPQRFRLALLTVLLIVLGLLTMIPSVRDWTNNLWTSFSSPSTSTQEENDTNSPSSLPSLTGDVPGNLPISPDEVIEQPTTLSQSEENKEQTATNNQPTDTNKDQDEVTNEDSQAETGVQSTNSNNEESTQTKASEQTDSETAITENASSNNKTNTISDSSTEGDTQLKLIFAEEVWIQIKDHNGKRLYEALHPAGTEKTLSLNSPLKFRVGNAPGMKLFVNKEEMNVSEYTKGSVATFGIE